MVLNLSNVTVNHSMLMPFRLCAAPAGGYGGGDDCDGDGRWIWWWSSSAMAGEIKSVAEYRDADSVERAVMELKDSELQGRRMFVRKVGSCPISTCLCVCGDRQDVCVCALTLCVLHVD